MPGEGWFISRRAGSASPRKSLPSEQARNGKSPLIAMAEIISAAVYRRETLIGSAPPRGLRRLGTRKCYVVGLAPHAAGVNSTRPPKDFETGRGSPNGVVELGARVEV